MKTEFIVRGGLGNQLFIILEAYKLYLTAEHKILLNLTEYNTNNRPDRSFVAEVLLPNILTDFRVSTGFRSRLRFFLAKLGAKFSNREVRNSRLPGDTTCTFNMFGCGRMLIGYFQYIGSTPIEEAALMRMKVMFSESFSKSNDYVNKLAVHVRRGDYLLEKHSMHGLVRVSDLRNEVERALQEGGFDGITLFSDSPELLDISDFDSFGINVTLDQGGEPTDVLKRMADHAGIIASNSSFSLWAGLLGQPRYFSMPQFWMPGIESSRLGINWVRRFPCTL